MFPVMNRRNSHHCVNKRRSNSGTLREVLFLMSLMVYICFKHAESPLMLEASCLLSVSHRASEIDVTMCCCYLLDNLGSES